MYSLTEEQRTSVKEHIQSLMKSIDEGDGIEGILLTRQAAKNLVCHIDHIITNGKSHDDAR